MLTSIKRDGHFGRPKTASFDSRLKMDQLTEGVGGEGESILGYLRKVRSVFSVKKL